MSTEQNKYIGPISLSLSLRNGATVQCRLYFYSGRETYHILEFGNVKGTSGTLVRIESACTFAHLYGSVLCDCEAQLDKALQIFAEAKNGLLVYALDQHGRGVGLLRHIQVYEQEEKGCDTVEAHQSLGLPIDARFYDEIGEILKKFQLYDIRLLTNNPSRIKAIQNTGITVRRIPHETQLNIFNCRELMIKKEKLGHLFSFVSDSEWIDLLQVWYSQVNADASQRWAVVLIKDFKDEVLRIHGDNSTIERAVADIVSQLLGSQSVLCVYLICALSSNTRLDLHSLSSIASTTRVILAGRKSGVTPDKNFVKVPNDLRELKLI